MITEETIKKQLDSLFEEGSALAGEFGTEQEELQDRQEKAEQGSAEEQGQDPQEQGGETINFEFLYQCWYSRCLPLMSRLAPDRYAEFQAYYHPNPKREVLNGFNYVIQDYLCRRPPEEETDVAPWLATLRCLYNQLAILKSITARLEWQGLDTEDQVGRSLNLSVLETARDLIRISERAAGALAGAVPQGYLGSLAVKHKVKLSKKSASPRKLADALKTARILDVPAWSQATWLAEIRDRCLQAQGEPPTKPQVRDLIDGTHWLITNVF